MEQTPKWLRKGASFTYEKSSTGAKHFLITLFGVLLLIVGIIIVFGDSPARTYFPIVGVGMGFLVYITTEIFKRNAGRNPKWQKKYLQSKINEYECYAVKVENLINAANKECESVIAEIRENLSCMKKKCDEAQSLLVQMS